MHIALFLDCSQILIKQCDPDDENISAVKICYNISAQLIFIWNDDSLPPSTLDDLTAFHRNRFVGRDPRAFKAK